MPDVTTSPTVEALTVIWQRVLRLPSIGVEDNFFDLGGDSVLAVQLFAEIAEFCGQQLPPVLIYHVPTIAAQAALMEKPAEREFSPLVSLRPGSEQTPVFIAPGLGGGPAEFFQLVKHIETSQAIYGLQPRGLDGYADPPEDIHEMADFYLAAIRQRQSHGPYFLFGYSFGGLVALEMARRLCAKGEEIALLVMLDSYLHISRMPMWHRIRLRTQRVGFLVASKIFRRKPSRPPSALDPSLLTTFAPGMDTVRGGAFRALRGYQPVFYNGNVKFVRAEILTDFPPDPVAVWANFVESIDVATVPGDHLSMITSPDPTLGSLLTRYLEEAGSTKSISGRK